MEQFIGIVRGRTVNSTRGHQGDQAQRKRKAKSRKPAAGKTLPQLTAPMVIAV